MKLLRYGTNGHEMPGLLDDKGHRDDLSGEVQDIFEEVLLPLSLDRLGVQHQSVLAGLSLTIRRYPPAHPQPRK